MVQRQGSHIDDVRIDHSTARIVMLGVPDVPGVASKVFSPLAGRGIGAQMIVQNSMRGGMTDIGFLVKQDSLDEAILACRAVAADIEAQGVSFNTEIARVTIAGAGLSEDPAVAANTFTALAEVGVNIEMIVSSSLSVTCVVAASDAEKARQALRKCFGLE
jgi:aspartate kinase